MSVLSAPPTTTKYEFKKGDNHVGVWALQRLFNDIYAADVPETGFFGTTTDYWVRKYQVDVGLKLIDGVVGPHTQARIVRTCIVHSPHGTSFPKGLIEGIIQNESGRLLAAVNPDVPGGVDCGLTQRRVYSPYTEAAVAAGFDPIGNVSRSAAELWDRYETFSGRVGRGEYAWRLAALGHNWPSGADQLSRGLPLSTTKQATWAPANTRFHDGALVYSWADWANFYAMGSRAHNHPGLVTGLAFGLPG